MKVCPQCQTHYPDDVEFCANDGMKLRRELSEHEDALLGQVLDGRWIIDSKLGEGGMGSVYLGRQKSVNRKVAIKTLKPELVNSSEFVDRFFREAQMATTINHPNCVTILDFGQTQDNLLFLAMEYLEGMPLADRLAEQPTLTLDEVLHITDEIAAALSAAHSHQIVHRDLKPDNIFLQKTPDGHMHSKLLDFGIAKDANASTQFTRTGQIFGTPDYMSPEQCSGHELDGRSDLYSLGCILYEMLSGAPPFENTNSMAVLMAHVTEQPRKLSGEIPHVVEQLVFQLLSKDPSRRPESASALRTQITEVRALLHQQGASLLPAAASSDALRADAFAETVAGDALPDPIASARLPTAAVAFPLKDTSIETQETSALTTMPSRPSSKAPLAILAIVAVCLIAGGSLFAMSSFSSSNEDANATSIDAAQEQRARTEASTSAKERQEKASPEPDTREADKGTNLPPADAKKATPSSTEPEETPIDSQPTKKKKKGKKKASKKESSAPPKELDTSTDRPRKKAKHRTPQSSDIDIPDVPKQLEKEIQKELPKIKKKVKTKSDQIVDDLFR